jgi:hypothetical protein
LIGAYVPDPNLYRSEGCPAWIEEIDLTAGAHHVRMGTRALREDRWLVADALATSELALRRRLLTEQRDHVFACNPMAEGAAVEAAQLIEHAIGADAPAPSDESHPLARAGSRVQEDLCLMVRHHGAWHLEGAVLCFPSRWNLAEKMGHTAAVVHQPVAHYAEELSDRVDTFFDRLAPDKLVWRRNVSLWPACLLWVPHRDIDPALWDVGSDDPARPTLWLRSELQTLRRLRGTGAILFTIRVQMAPLSVLSTRPDRAGELADWLRAPSGESRRLELGLALEHDLDWLDAVAAAGGPGPDRT